MGKRPSLRKRFKEHFKKFDLGEYSKEIFGMFDGKKEDATLLCENWAVDIR